MDKDPNTLIAMQQKDIDFLKDVLREVKLSIVQIGAKIDLYNTTFVRKEDYKLDLEDLKRKVDEKVSTTDFQSLKGNVDWVGRAIIGEILTVIGLGIVALITHFSK